MIGSSLTSTAYKIWDASLERIILSRNVYFDEQSHLRVGSFPQTVTSNDSSHSFSPAADSPFSPSSPSNISSFENNSPGAEDSTAPEVRPTSNISPSSPCRPTRRIIPPVRLSCGARHIQISKSSAPSSSVSVTTSPDLPHRSSRLVEQSSAADSTSYYCPYFVGDVYLSTAPSDVPSSYKEAISPRFAAVWQPALNLEHQSLLKNDTWTIVPRLSHMDVLPCMYIFRQKQSGPKSYSSFWDHAGFMAWIPTSLMHRSSIIPPSESCFLPSPILILGCIRWTSSLPSYMETSQRPSTCTFPRQLLPRNRQTQSVSSIEPFTV